MIETAICPIATHTEVPAAEIIAAIDAATAADENLLPALARIGTTPKEVRLRGKFDAEIESAIERWSAARAGQPIPTPEELRARCLEVQAEWSPRERESRTVAAFREVAPLPIPGTFRPGPVE